MKIYIDSEYCCHSTNPDGFYRELILSESAKAFFDNKCITFIEGYRLIPSDETWIREDGIDFTGEMIAPWKPYDGLDAAQREYERQLLSEKDTIIAELDALVLNLQYNSLMEGL